MRKDTRPNPDDDRERRSVIYLRWHRKMRSYSSAPDILAHALWLQGGVARVSEFVPSLERFVAGSARSIWGRGFRACSKRRQVVLVELETVSAAMKAAHSGNPFARLIDDVVRSYPERFNAHHKTTGGHLCPLCRQLVPETSGDHGALGGSSSTIHQSAPASKNSVA